ncbi:amidohydrolase family protein [Streptomyces sp. NPDC127068]|uniref:amidohydrolase family protein n=1 Tax=Streptomyces sp. NPDC127068 TaxID=3347127 RepID=UPI0036601D9C
MPETTDTSTTTERSLLIKGATVLTMDPELGDLTTGDILVTGDRITAVGPDLDDRVTTDTEVIQARGMIAVPGLIDTHMHAWQTPLKGLYADGWTGDDYQSHVFYLREHFRPEDIYDATFSGTVQMLDAGVTGVLDFCHNVMSPEGAEAGLRAHRATGQRALFAYGMLGSFGAPPEDHAWRLDHVRRLHDEVNTDGDGLLRVGMALGSIEYGSMDRITKEVALARELGLRMSVHQNPPGQIRALHEAGLLDSDIVPAHANSADDGELALLARCGGGISFTPEGEFGGGRSMTILNRAHRAGASPSLGIDTHARVSIDLFAAMRLTYLLMRNVDATTEREAGRWPLERHPGVPLVQPRDILAYATVNAAAALGLGDDLGRLTPGRLADIVLIDTEPYGVALGDPAAHVVLQTTPRDVDTVVVGGRIRKRDGRLTDLDPTDAGAATRRVRERVFAEAAAHGGPVPDLGPVR